jgi:hypothetical protein
MVFRVKNTTILAQKITLIITSTPGRVETATRHNIDPMSPSGQATEVGFSQQGSMLLSQFSAIFDNFRRKIGVFLKNQCYDQSFA